MYNNLVLVVDVCSRIWAGEHVSFLEVAAVIGVLATIYSIVATTIGVVCLFATGGRKGFAKVRAVGRAFSWLAYQGVGRWFALSKVCQNACKLLTSEDTQVSGEKRQVVQAGPLVVYLDAHAEHGKPDQHGHTLEKVFAAGEIRLHGGDLRHRLTRRERRRIISVARWARKTRLARELAQAREVAAFEMNLAEQLGKAVPAPEPKKHETIGRTFSQAQQCDPSVPAGMTGAGTLTCAGSVSWLFPEEAAALANLSPAMRKQVLDQRCEGKEPVGNGQKRG